MLLTITVILLSACSTNNKANNLPMSIVKKVSVYATIAVPLILNAMAKSQKLEVVLQSKAFSGSSKRTYLHESILTSTDYVCMVGFISLFIVATFLYFYAGVGKFPWLLYS